MQTDRQGTVDIGDRQRGEWTAWTVSAVVAQSELRTNGPKELFVKMTTKTDQT